MAAGIIGTEVVVLVVLRDRILLLVNSQQVVVQAGGTGMPLPVHAIQQAPKMLRLPAVQAVPNPQVVAQVAGLGFPVPVHVTKTAQAVRVDQRADPVEEVILRHLHQDTVLVQAVSTGMEQVA